MENKMILVTNDDIIAQDLKKTKKEMFSDFSGETMTLAEAEIFAGKSKVTILKIMKQSGITAVGKIVTGSRGRPASIYNRSELIEALKT